MGILYIPYTTIRNDYRGAGYFHALRKKDGKEYLHMGTDHECIQHEPFLSPISGHISRVVRCYSDTKEYKGIVIENDDICLKVLYVDCQHQKYHDVQQGQVIGFCQDIGRRYPGCKTHIHYQIEWISPSILV